MNLKAAIRLLAVIILTAAVQVKALCAQSEFEEITIEKPRVLGLPTAG